MKAFVKILILFAAILISGAALAHSYQFKDLKIGHAWMRAVPESMDVAAGYVPLLNEGKTPDRLLRVEGDWFKSSKIHQTMIHNDQAEMAAMENGLELSPGKPVAMRPKGTHIMFFGVKAPIAKGDKKSAVLVFEKSGNLPIEFHVESISAEQSGD